MRNATVFIAIAVSTPLAAQTRTIEVGRVSVSGTSISAEATNLCLIHIEAAGARIQGSASIEPNEVRVWKDSASYLAGVSPSRERGERLYYRYSNYGLGFERRVNDQGDSLRLVIGGAAVPVVASALPQVIALFDSAASRTFRMSSSDPNCQNSSSASIATGARGDNPAVVADGGTIYFEFQVEKQVSAVPGAVNLRYPDMLRSANVEGEVLVQFVVDTNGRADLGSFKVLKSSHELFTNSVKNALAQMRFYPAEIAGRKVRQLLQQPFTFTLPDGARAASPNYPPTATEMFIPPLPVPASVRGFQVVAEFDVDEKGKVLGLKFTQTPNAGYNKRLEEVLRSFRFRPGTRPDGTPVRMTAKLSIPLP